MPMLSPNGKSWTPPMRFGGKGKTQGIEKRSFPRCGSSASFARSLGQRRELAGAAFVTPSSSMFVVARMPAVGSQAPYLVWRSIA